MTSLEEITEEVQSSLNLPHYRNIPVPCQCISGTPSPAKSDGEIGDGTGKNMNGLEDSEGI